MCFLLVLIKHKDFAFDENVAACAPFVDIQEKLET
jgi:hypothetical protein